MKYELSYKDINDNLVTEIIEADTDKKAINQVEKILKDVVFKSPQLTLMECDIYNALL